MKNHFIMAYNGNKRQEVERIYNNIVINENITTIIEPYAGTSALSYYISTKHPKKYKYILNDIDANIFNLYNIMKNKDLLMQFEIDVNNAAKTIIDKTTYNIVVKQKNFVSWFISHKIYMLRPGYFRLNYKYTYLNFFDVPIVKFLLEEDVTITNIDGVECFKLHNLQENLIFLDPPYLLSDNSYFDCPTHKKMSIYEYLYNKNINTMLCKVIIVVEINWIINLLFDNIPNKIIYFLLYLMVKKKTLHTLIQNIPVLTTPTTTTNTPIISTTTLQ